MFRAVTTYAATVLSKINLELLNKKNGSEPNARHELSSPTRVQVRGLPHGKLSAAVDIGPPAKIIQPSTLVFSRSLRIQCDELFGVGEGGQEWYVLTS